MKYWITHPNLTPAHDQQIEAGALAAWAGSGWQIREDQTDPDDSTIEQVYEQVQSCGPGGCSSTATIHPTLVAQPSARVIQGDSCDARYSVQAVEGRKKFQPVKAAGRFFFGRRCR